MLLPYIPKDFLGFIPMFGSFPVPFFSYSIGIGQLYNIVIIFLILYLLFQNRRQTLYYKNGLMRKYACYLISGKTGKGKTRFLTQVARDCKNKNNIVITNFYNGYADLFYSSFKDFCLLQVDIARLGIKQNFNEKEKKIIERFFPNYFKEYDLEIAKKLNKIKKQYDFITIGDEFYAYLHSRSFMANFSKEDGKKLLLDLHQTRHSKQTLLLASQDSDNLDLDLRQLAHNEIEVNSWLLDLFYGFNIYKYLTKKEQKTAGLEFKKINFIPYWFFNYFSVYSGLNNIFYIYQYFLNKILLKVKKNYIFKGFKDLEFLKTKKLDYNTRFNIRTDLNIYKSGDLFDFLIEKEKKENLLYKNLEQKTSKNDIV